MLCYDVEFPETVRAASLAGAHLVAVPSAQMEPFHFIAEQVLGVDPLVGVFGSMAGVAAVGMMILMLTTSVAVLAYFSRNPDLTPGPDVQTRIAAALACVGLLGSLWLVLTNFRLVTGGSATVSTVLALVPVVGLIAGWSVVRRAAADVTSPSGRGLGPPVVRTGTPARHRSRPLVAGARPGSRVRWSPLARAIRPDMGTPAHMTLAGPLAEGPFPARADVRGLPPVQQASAGAHTRWSSQRTSA